MYFGVDGCPGGWLAIGVDEREVVMSHLATSFAALMRALERPRLVLVDMPIGLPSAAVPERGCDRAARALLGRRGASVFPVPSRAALAAEDYATACEINAAELGKRLSRQTWNICAKIRELDAFLARGQPRCAIREMHPEVAFAVLNGGAPIAGSKKRAAGRDERLRVLERHLGAARDAVTAVRAQYGRRQVGDDDILDALVGAVATADGLGRYFWEYELVAI